MVERTRPRRGTLTRRGRAALAMQQPTGAVRMSTAATRQLSEKQGRSGSTQLIREEKWQTQAYARVIEVAELGFAVNFIAQAVARGDLVIDEHDERGNLVTADSDGRGKAERVLAAFQGPTGGTSQILRSGALHDMIAGEGHLFGIPVPGESNQISWELLSVTEVNEDSNGTVTRKKRPKGADAEKLSESTFTARYHRPDPQYSEQATSMVQRVLPIADEIVSLTQMISTTIWSRIAAGAIYIPEELSFGAEDEAEEPIGDDDGEGEELDPFEEALVEHMSAPKEDMLSAASLVPLIFRGPAEFAEAIQTIELSKDDPSWAITLRKEALDRLAASIELPRELLEGMGAVNHWGAYAISKQFVTEHVEPIGSRLAEFFTVSYLRKMLVHAEQMSAEQAARFSLRFEVSGMLAQADETASARALYDRGELSGKGLRNASGFTEEEAPDEQELLRRAVLNLVLKAPAVALGLSTSAPAAPAAEAPAPAPEDPPDRDGGQEPPGADGEVAAVNPYSDSEYAPDRVAEWLRVLADQTLRQAVSRARSKAINFAGRDAALREELHAVPDDAVLAHIGADRLEALGCDPGRLFDRAWDQFNMASRSWLRSMLEDGGTDPMVADEIAALRTSTLQRHLAVMAASALDRPLTPARNGLIVPADIIRDAVATAEGVLV